MFPGSALATLGRSSRSMHEANSLLEGAGSIQLRGSSQIGRHKCQVVETRREVLGNNAAGICGWVLLLEGTQW